MEAAAYYVIAESLANVSKYAEASEVTVRVTHDNGCARIEVADDGVGGADAAADPVARARRPHRRARRNAHCREPPGGGTRECGDPLESAPQE